MNKSGRLKYKRHFGELCSMCHLSLQNSTFQASSVSCMGCGVLVLGSFFDFAVTL